MPIRYKIACAVLSCAAFVAVVLFFLTCDACPALAASSAVVGSFCVWLNCSISNHFDPEYYDNPEKIRNNGTI